MRKSMVVKEGEETLLNNDEEKKCRCPYRCSNRCKCLTLVMVFCGGLFAMGGYNIYLIETDGSSSDMFEFLPSF